MNQLVALFSKTTFLSLVMIIAAVSAAWGYDDDYAGQKRVLMLGDSITRGIAGEAVKNAIGYQVQEAFAGLANVHILSENFQDTDFALSEVSTGVTHIEKWINNETWDVIDFNTGLHDMNLSSYKYDTPSNYATKLGQVIDEVKAHAGSAALIWRETTFVPNPEGNNRHKAVDGVTATDNAHQAYNAVAEPVVTAKGITVIDRVADLSATAERVAADNVHYTTDGYRKIAVPVIENIYNQLGLSSGMRVDLGNSGTDGDLVQEGYYDFQRTASTRFIATDLGTQNQVTMTLGNATGSQNGDALGAAGTAASDLLRDGVFAENDAALGVTISGLKAGNYLFTGYFHDSDTSHGTLDVNFSIDGGQSFTDAMEVVCSTGISPTSLGMGIFPFACDGNSDLVIQISNAGGDGIAFLNGFEISETTVPEPSTVVLLLLGVSTLVLFKTARK